MLSWGRDLSAFRARVSEAQINPRMMCCANPNALSQPTPGQHAADPQQHVAAWGQPSRPRVAGRSGTHIGAGRRGPSMLGQLRQRVAGLNTVTESMPVSLRQHAQLGP